MSKPRFGAMCSCSTQCEVVEGAEKVDRRRLKVNGHIHDEEAEDYESEVEEEDEDSDIRPGLVDSSEDEEEEKGSEVIDSSDDEEVEVPKPLALVDLDYPLEKCSESSFSLRSKLGMSFA